MRDFTLIANWLEHFVNRGPLHRWCQRFVSKLETFSNVAPVVITVGRRITFDTRKAFVYWLFKGCVRGRHRRTEPSITINLRMKHKKLVSLRHIFFLSFNWVSITFECKLTTNLHHSWERKKIATWKDLWNFLAHYHWKLYVSFDLIANIVSQHDLLACSFFIHFHEV